MVYKNKNLKNTETVARKKADMVEEGNLNREGGSTSNTSEGSNTIPLIEAKEAKEISKAKQRYRTRRSAKKILDRWAATPEGQLTPEQRQSVAWARKTFCGEGTEGDSGSKRQRSHDEPEASASKKAKLQAGAKVGNRQGVTEQSPRLFSDIVKEHGVMLAVIDSSHEDGSITGERWWKVYNALNSVFLKVMKENPGPPPSCRDAGWYQGRVKLTACLDQRSADLYRQALKEVGELWPGAKLAAVSREEIPSRPRARVWLPAASGIGEILEIIRASNPDLPTNNWKIVKQEEAKGSFRLSIMVINRESLAPLAIAKGVMEVGSHSGSGR